MAGFKKVNKGGRPPILDEELIDRICNIIRGGNYIETAAVFCGVNKTTLYDWMKKGAKERDGIYRQFSNAMEIALAESELRDVQHISNAAEDGVWQAAAWRLERKNAGRWGRREHITAEVESTMTQRTELLVEHQLKNDPESAELLRQLYRRQNAVLLHDDADA